MQKCYSCSKQFPDVAMNKMVHIVDRKAYLINICPSCQTIVANNPTYYPLVEKNVSPGGAK